jgi:hypothetical protein
MTSAFVKVDAKQDKFRKTYTCLSTEKTPSLVGEGLLSEIQKTRIEPGNMFVRFKD